MLFNSLQFLIFFPVVTFLYFMLPYRFRWFLLLISSCIFYMAFIPKYILILAITIIIDYIAGIYIEKSNGRNKKVFLIISIISTCAVLFVFKYLNFFNSNFSVIARFFHWKYPIGVLNIILPIGLSFHTFQSLSYVIEVYRGNQKAEHHFGIYALYVMFYPQLVAGPIERPYSLLHQFYEKHNFEYRKVADGLKLITWGIFKKVVIADRAAVFVQQVYGNPFDYHGLSLILATIFFAFQIYCDFSGYSDVAIGAAWVMGFKLMDNFNRPYSAVSIAEFWKKWHISLSSWFRDYVYIPLGGNRVIKARWFFNIFITFLLSGLWHGANWTFVIWGVLNGVYIIVGRITKGFREKLFDLIGLNFLPSFRKVLQVLGTFSLVTFSWIFFISKDLKDSSYVATHFYHGLKLDILSLFSNNFECILLDQNMNNLLIVVFSIIFMELVHFSEKHRSMRHMLSDKPVWFRWPVYYLMFFGIIFFGIFGESFIYFQF